MERPSADGTYATYTPLPSRAQIQGEARAFQCDMNEAIATGKSAHQLAVAAIDALYAFAGTMREHDRVAYLMAVGEEQHALIHASDWPCPEEPARRDHGVTAMAWRQSAGEQRGTVGSAFVNSARVRWRLLKGLNR